MRSSGLNQFILVFISRVDAPDHARVCSVLYSCILFYWISFGFSGTSQVGFGPASGLKPVENLTMEMLTQLAVRKKSSFSGVQFFTSLLFCSDEQIQNKSNSDNPVSRLHVQPSFILHDLPAPDHNVFHSPPLKPTIIHR
jgi:hypothetical protein